MSKFLIAKSEEEEYWALVGSVEEAKTHASGQGWAQLWLDDANPAIPSHHVPSTEAILEQIEESAYDNLNAEDEVFNGDIKPGSDADKELQQLLETWADKHLSSSWYTCAGSPRRIEDYKGHFKK